MTPEEVTARTNVHDGYMFRVLALNEAPVEQRGPLTQSQSTLDYLAGYSPKLQRWIRLPDGRLRKGMTYVGVRATLRAVQAGGENWQAILIGPTGHVKRLFVTAYQARGPGAMRDCFGDYLTQRQSCQGRIAEVLWFLEARCLQPGVSTFALQDQPSGGEQPVASLTVMAPGRASRDGADPCAVTGTARTDLLTFYAPGIDPSSFRAKLNGRDVSTLFHPYAGWREVSGVPLMPGVNRLDLAVKGVIDRKRRTERVRLIYVVPEDRSIQR